MFVAQGVYGREVSGRCSYRVWMGSVESRWEQRMVIVVAGSGGVDGFECLLNSQIGGLVMEQALASIQRDYRVLKWCTACRGGPARPSSGVEALDGRSSDLRTTDSGVPGLIEWFNLPWNRRPGQIVLQFH